MTLFEPPRRVLVTGGAGFIGSAVCRRLVAGGAAVLNVDSLTYAGHPGSVADLEGAPGYVFARADIRDRDAVAALMASFRPDAIVNLAAETHVDRSIMNADAFVTTNVVGVQILLDCARAHRDGLNGEERDRFRFLQVSTDEVYGSLTPDEPAFAETRAYDPSSPYAASKAAADHLVLAWARTYGLPALVSNCSNNYGPRQFPEKLIPLMILGALHGQPLPVYGVGTQVRDWLHVEDHAEALETILTRGRTGEKYNVGARCERRNIDVVRAICAILDRLRPDGAPHDRLIAFVADRPGHDARYAIDPGKIEAELGWRPRHSFEAGLTETVRWYHDNESWWRPLRERVYRGERLGLVPAAAT